MPWHIGDHADCSGFAVIKDGDGSLAGCHDTRDEAEAQMAALYASEDIEEADTYTPTDAMVASAKRGLELRREYGRGGTEVGVARARDISNGKGLPLVTVKRMHSFFSRHEGNKKAEGFNRGEDGYPSAGRVAWELWGGDAGQRWAARIVAQNEDDEMGELAEAKMKDGHARGDFLVVGDPDETSTWHLPVKTGGEPDHRLMGAAKAALTVGYRGNVYEGPDKQAAIRALKAMYDAEDMEWDDDVAELDTSEMSLGALSELVRVAFLARYQKRTDDEPYGTEVYYWTRDIFVGHPTFGDAMIVECKGALYLVPFSLDGEQIEFMEPWQKVRQTYELVEEPPAPMAEPPNPMEEAALSEAATGRVIAIEEAETATGLVPLTLDVALIEPGPGNAHDRHYYPAEVLRRDAKVFKGGKMHATDHRETEKSVGTWVSTIKACPVGFTESGAPIARVVVHKDWFARDIRALQAEGLLEKMECSIIGSGKAKKGKVNEAEYNIVEAITEGSADWVTKAGAGGHALALAESDTHTNGGETVNENEHEQDVEVQEAETVTLREENADPPQEPEDAQSADGEQDQADAEEATPEAACSAERVGELLAESGLGEDARRLLDRPYESEQAVQDAIAEFKRILKRASGSGQPFAQGEPGPAQERQPISEADRQARYKRIKERYGLTYDVEVTE